MLKFSEYEKPNQFRSSKKIIPNPHTSPRRDLETFVPAKKFTKVHADEYSQNDFLKNTKEDSSYLNSGYKPTKRLLKPIEPQGGVRILLDKAAANRRDPFMRRGHAPEGIAHDSYRDHNFLTHVDTTIPKFGVNTKQSRALKRTSDTIENQFGFSKEKTRQVEKEEKRFQHKLERRQQRPASHGDIIGWNSPPANNQKLAPIRPGRRLGPETLQPRERPF